MNTIPGRKSLSFSLFCCGYAALTIIILSLFFWGSWNKYENLEGIVTGIIIGSFFPFISLRYFYLNYLVDNQESQSLLGWIGPALLLHIIIIFGFLITISMIPQENRYTSSMFTGFYEYGKIYKSFQEKESQILKNPGVLFVEDSQENGPELSFTNFMVFYGAYFTDSKDLKQPKSSKDRSEAYTELAHRINYIPAAISLTFGFLAITNGREPIKRKPPSKSLTLTKRW